MRRLGDACRHWRGEDAAEGFVNADGLGGQGGEGGENARKGFVD